MDINRNNYEEYFLLYADNELTDSEKVEVIMFLKDNKDLEEEFRMIHYTISRPDVNIKLANKSLLFRTNEGSFISKENYEEIFVLYHDNELTEDEKLQTEEFLSHQVQLKNEFDLIGLARLTPEDSVVFANKKKLYKKEKTGKVVPVIFWRALVAAVFIGSGLWVTLLYTEKGAEKLPITAQSIPAKQSLPVVEKNEPTGRKPVNAVVTSVQPSSKLSATGINGEKGKLPKLLPQKKTNNIAFVKPSAKTQKQVEENQVKPAAEKINDETVIINEKIKNIPKEEVPGSDIIESPREIAQNTIKTGTHLQPVLHVQNISYIQDATDNAQNYVFYDITTEEFKKTKMGSFLKKVKRVIERNNPISRLLSGDEKQVVSN